MTAAAASETTSALNLDALRRYRRAADYITLAQIYLKGNVLLREPLKSEHIKDRLLGHWGTSPGINLVYAHLNRLARAHQAHLMYLIGPGHGGPAGIANIYLEGALSEVYPDLPQNADGLARLARLFSWPGGFPSHMSPALPGVIHEGGELGYALSTAFGAALDNPDLIVTCLVGDGENETGPSMTAWHGNKYLDPATCGAVLPILHDNGYKIASATIGGTSNDEETEMLYRGLGWEPRFVEGSGDALDVPLAEALDWAYEKIRALQHDARTGARPAKPIWPMIVLRSPKGMGCPKTWHGAPLEGTWRAHQVPIDTPKTDPAALDAVETWMRSYKPEELFDENGRPHDDILATCPTGEWRMSVDPLIDGGTVRKDLDVPPMQDYEAKLSGRGVEKLSAMHRLGEYLRDTMTRTMDDRNFRIMCPDELVSNKLDAVLDVTKRAYQWPLHPAAADIDVAIGPDGRVMEVLSEHQCQGWLQGYVLTGRHGLFPCYEAFIAIVDGMVNQYAKFLKQSKEVAWRKPVASMNYLLSSDGWRQDHNGYSHQNPGFINELLTKKGAIVRIYLPPDANTLLTAIDHCLRSKNYVNLVVATKNEMAQWLSLEEATAHARAGASIWTWASIDDGKDPDIVLAAAGNTPTLEILAAAQLLYEDAPDLRVRVINVMDLLVLDNPREHPHGLGDDAFKALFPTDTEVIFAFHGYPSACYQLLFSRPQPHRFHVFGYQEEGSTTTPFDMVVLNGISRYQLAIEALRRSPKLASIAGELIERYEEVLTKHRAYVQANGDDLPEVKDWQWSRP